MLRIRKASLNNVTQQTVLTTQDIYDHSMEQIIESFERQLEERNIIYEKHILKDGNECLINYHS